MACADGTMPTMQEFVQWLEALPRDGDYDYTDASSCPLAEYGKDHGYILIVGVPRAPFFDLLNRPEDEMNYTMLLERARKLV